MADLIEQVQIGNNLYNIASTAYGVCTETAATPAKTVNIPGFYLKDGVTIHVRFANANTAATPTLNVSGTGAKEIRLNDATNAGEDPETTGWKAGAIVSLTYVEVDSTHAYWYRDQGYNTNSTYTVKDTYSGTDGDPISGKGVKAALETLDVSNISGFGADKTLSALSETDGKISASFQSIQIAESQVTNLTTDLGLKAPLANPSFTGVVTLPAISSSSADTAAATKKYVDDSIGGLSGAMHFRGTTTTVMSDGLTTANVTINDETYTPTAGDVVLYSGAEYVWTGTLWELLGDESSYALASNVISKNDITAAGQLIYGSGNHAYTMLNPNTSTTDGKVLYMINSTPSWKQLGLSNGAWSTLNVTKTVKFLKTASLTTGTAFSVPNVTSVGSPTTAEVDEAVLKITLGSAPTLANNNFSIPNVTGISTADEEAVTAVTINGGTWPTISYT